MDMASESATNTGATNTALCSVDEADEDRNAVNNMGHNPRVHKQDVGCVVKESLPELMTPDPPY